MKKLLFSVLLLAGAATINNANAQLPDGSIAPNFTVTDINGQSHTLYDYLDQGYTVIIDLNATWCPPCWSYHQGGALEDLWMNHGPAGGNGVSANTTDDVIVFMIESDGSTTSADLNGSTSGTMGDWVTGTDFFIVDDNSVASAYALAYYPTIYTICPNRILEESGQASSSAHYSNVSVCPAANGSNNPGIIAYNGETSACGAMDVDVTIQNMGTANLTAATIELKQGGTTINSLNWTGNLATYDLEVVTVGSVTPSGTQTYSIEITSPDDNSSDNTWTQSISEAIGAGSMDVTIEIITDAYGSETTWELKNSSGATVSSGGPYNNLSAAGTTTQTPVDVTLTNSSDCYDFIIYDSYGDGMDSGYGNGSYSVKDTYGNTLVSGGDFTDEDGGKFKSGSVSIVENGINELNIYPNPFNNIATVSFNVEGSERTSLDVINTIGQTVQSIDLGVVSGAQLVELNAINLPSGFYFVNIKSGFNSVTSRITVNK